MALFRKNKKGLTDTLKRILTVTFAFITVIAFFEFFKGPAEAAAAETICRGSVAAREKFHWEKTIGGQEVTEIAPPLFCRTIDKYLPEDKNAKKDDIKKEIADLMAQCWARYLEGRIPDVFKEGDPMYKNCQICYTVSLRKTKNFKGENAQIPSEEMHQYLFQNPYKVYEYGDFCSIKDGSPGGFCIDGETASVCGEKVKATPSYLLIDKNNEVCKQKGKKSCCYTDYECWNKGGICSSTNPDTKQFQKYSWDCPKKMSCYVKKEDYFSYGQYIQQYGGQGNALIIVKEHIHPGETYAISFGSPTKECGWCDEAAKAGAAGAVVGTLLAIVKGGAVLALVSHPVGAVIGLGGAAFIGYFGAKYGSETFNDEVIVKLLSEREISTVYFTTLNDVISQQNCRLVKDIRES